MTATQLDAFSPDRPVVLIGAGNMGGAMARGWLAAGLATDALVVVDPRDDGLPEPLSQARHVASAADLPGDLKAGILILAVKPQLMDVVLPQVRGLVGDETIVVSVAAGVLIKTLRAGLDLSDDASTLVLRAMPNTPSAIGKGITAVTGVEEGAPVRGLVDVLLSGCGPVVWVSEETDLDAVTGVSGSGPAYVFFMVEAMTRAGVAHGLAEETAEQLARQTVIGAAALLDKTGEPAGELRRQVTSPNGTTAAGLSVLMADPGLAQLMEKVVGAAAGRSRELSQGG